MKTPPFLLGATLLFWGWQTGLLPFAVFIAIVLEGARFIPFRWDFALAEVERIADICSLLLIGILIYLFTTKEIIEVTFILFQWLPMAIVPLLACQAYSTNGKIDLRALFLMLRRKRAKTRATPLLADLTYPYLILCILSAGTANVRNSQFYFGLVALTVWALWPLRSRRYSSLIWISMLVLAGIAGHYGHLQLYWLQFALERNVTLLRLFTGFQEDTDPYQSTTAIGDIGAVKLSNRVLFRVKAETKVQLPLLLRETSYDAYKQAKWFAARSEFTDIQPDSDGTTWKIPSLSIHPLAPSLPRRDGEEGVLPPLSLASAKERGPGGELLTVSSYLTKGEGILKSPTGTFQIEHLPVGKMARNQFGALKVQDGPGLITYQTFFDAQGSPDSPPNERDLFIPPDEIVVIRKLTDELALQSKSPQEILQSVAAFFQERFSYSLELPPQIEKTTPLANFLDNSRTGHCEYFATATVLLLRAAGIPARYAVGYSIDEFDQDGGWALVRGRDAHAWTLVYLNGTWQDFDTTPPSWRQVEQTSIFEWLPNLWSRLMFAWSEWWWREHNWENAKYLMVVPVLGLLWLGRKLFAKKRVRRVIEPHGDVSAHIHYPGEDSAFYLIAQRLHASGFSREPWESLSQWLNRIEPHFSPLSIRALQSMLRLHYRYRFDPEGLTLEEQETFKASVQSWLKEDQYEKSSA